MMIVCRISNGCEPKAYLSRTQIDITTYWGGVGAKAAKVIDEMM